jgi:hypothetical protein
MTMHDDPAAQEAFDRIAQETMGGVSDWTSNGSVDYARADRDLRLIALLAGVEYTTNDAYKRMCEDCGWPLPLNDPSNPEDHAEWCEQKEN